MTAVTVEPKKVLQLINSMGYKNVSAAELKEFTKDLKKLIKYEQKPKQPKQNRNSSDNLQPQVVHAPENVINVTIIKEASPKKSVQTEHKTKFIGRDTNKAQDAVNTGRDCRDPERDEAVKLSKRLSRLPNHVKNKIRRVSIAQSDPMESETREPVKLPSKRLLRLSGHVRSKNPKIVYKNGGVSVKGVLVRNTPTDLYQKYQDDWIKFKSFIPGENDRQSVRRSIRKKMQQKDEDDDKVYVHFPDETGDH
ncbi:uncharacterized protein LOC116343794 [Contarinia nasturtii]|uniref:uncharacterized protein LOC116343794 n=1 Tax=Contarinia nasturtii TaxID=265458 RepID=UPI0012D49979|nr:uncharacterized protein LOC116343794 [Contarinia nasturtii]